MANPNILPSKQAVLAAVIDPQNANTAKSTPWVSLATFDAIQAIVAVGAIATGGTLDAKLEQAKDVTGTGAKDVTGKSITQLTDADDNQQAVINCRSDELDVNGGYTHVRLTVTPATAASDIFGAILGHYARYQPAAAAASVVEVIE